MLTKEELIKYQRQTILPEIGIDGQLNLKNAKVLMVGAGGLGCPVLQYLAAAGVGEIGIIDHDVVEITNLHRQILYNPQDIGINKAIVASEKIKALNPAAKINTYPTKLVVENCESIFKNYDLIIDGSDNFPTRYLINDTCVKLNKTLIFGAIDRFEGQVSVFNYQNGPNYRNIYPNEIANNTIQNCSEIGVINTLPAIVGSIMANEAIKVTCQLDHILSGKILAINALDYQFKIFNFKKTGSTTPNLKSNNTNEIDWNDYENAKDDFFLIDVREDHEFEEFNIGGINIPLYNLLEQKDQITNNKKIIFCCQTGRKSKMALEILKPFINQEMYSLKNGLPRY
jgi:molybdopterin/thiamine biosynthesis adenylyltransferase/rhodanese-related sulfurtransferase